MTELFEMLSTIARRRKKVSGSPFASLKTTEKWLAALPVDSDYDAHHALVDGLERFVADPAPATPERMASLLAIETAGLALQRGIVEQYTRNQAAFRLARQALWRESWAFWSLLGDAWLAMLKQAYRGRASAELKPHAAAMAVRALHYARLGLRWDYHQARVPGVTAWRRLHKIYRLAERDGLALQTVSVAGSATHCAREYALAVLMGLVYPVGYRAQEIEGVAATIETCGCLPLPEAAFEHGVHTHVVDLAVGEGAWAIEGEWLEGSGLRYFDVRGLVTHLKACAETVEDSGDGALTRQVASLIERGGVRRSRQRTHRFGRVWVAAGMGNILTALASADPGKIRPALEPWMLRDESTEGMGFALPEKPDLPHGHLVAVSWDPTEGVWQLMAIRWSRLEDGKHLIGTQRLSRHPKRVEIAHDGPAPAGIAPTIWGVFLPLTQPEHGVSNLLIPRAHYQLGAPMTLRDGDTLYRLHLGEVQESHEDWLRVGMDVVGREQLAAAA